MQLFNKAKEYNKIDNNESVVSRRLCFQVQQSSSSSPAWL